MSRSKMDCHALTDRGRVRPVNEDQFLIADLVKAVRIQSTSLGHDDQTEVTGQSQGKVFLVADGMGGHAAGRRASTVAVDEMVNYMVNRLRWHAMQRQTSRGDTAQAFSSDLVGALKYCEARIRNEANCMPEKRSMGTTLTVAVVDWPALYVVHAGDSRCYCYRDGKLKQLTRDHTVAQALVDEGVLTPDQADASDLTDALTNIVGGSPGDLAPEVYMDQLAVGDTLLLCTDGLTKHLNDKSMMEILDCEATAAAACKRLVERANARGGSDNITVVVARFHAKPPAMLKSATATEALRRDQQTQRRDSMVRDSMVMTR